MGTAADAGGAAPDVSSECVLGSVGADGAESGLEPREGVLLFCQAPCADPVSLLES